MKMKNKNSIVAIFLLIALFISMFTISVSAEINTYSKLRDGNKYLSSHFQVKEFACKDGSDTILIDSSLVAILQQIRDKFQKPVVINSAYRTPEYNKKIGGATNSFHTKGTAADITISGVPLLEIAKYAESIGAKGIGLYDSNNGNFLHIDTRGGTKYCWKQQGKNEISVSTFGGTPPTQTTNQANYYSKVTYYESSVQDYRTTNLRISLFKNVNSDGTLNGVITQIPANTRIFVCDKQIYSNGRMVCWVWYTSGVAGWIDAGDIR